MATWRATEPGDSTDVPVGAEYIRENNTQLEIVCTAARLEAGTAIPDYIPTGGTTTMWFYLNSAPVGWTEVSDLGDTLLAIKGGTTYTTGAATAGNWELPDHRLITSEMPRHTHSYSRTVFENKRKTATGLCASSYAFIESGPSGGNNQPHNHGGEYRPFSVVGILCSKD